MFLILAGETSFACFPSQFPSVGTRSPPAWVERKKILSDPVDIKSFASYIYIFRSTTRAVSTTDTSLCRGGHVLHIHWQRRPLTLSDCPLIQPRNHQQASHPLTHRERMLENPAREEDRRELADHHHQGERQRPVLKHERAGMSVILFCAPCASRVRRAKTSVRVFGTWRPGRNT